MFIVDNNISPKTIHALSKIYPGIRHVSGEGLDQKSDIDVWEYARKHGLHILTKDKDFKNVQGIRGSPPKVVWLKLGNVSTKQIISVLIKKETLIKWFIAKGKEHTLEIR